MIERVFVVLWDDDGEPNCAVYSGPHALCEGLGGEAKPILRAASMAVERRGEAIELPGSENRFLRYASVLP